MLATTIPRSFPPTLFAVLVLMACGGLLATTSLPWEIALAALLIICLGCLPFYLYLRFPHQASVPFFPAVGAFYAVFYGLPAFLILLGWSNADSILIYSRVRLTSLNIEAFLLVAGGLAVMILGFYTFRYPAFRRIPALNLGALVERRHLGVLFWGLMVIHLAFRLFPDLIPITSFRQLGEPAGYVAFGGLYLAWVRGELPAPQKILLAAICLPLELYVRSRSLFLTDLLYFMIFAIFLFWHSRSRLAVAGLGLLVILILSTFSATTAIRSHSAPGMDRIVNAAEKYVDLMAKGENTLLDELQLKSGTIPRFGPLVQRISHIWIFHVVDEISPETVPYWGGETYKPLLFSLVPRIIYPLKPKENTGGEFGRRYGFLEKTQFETSVNLPWLTELLANFGRSGVIWGMLAIGIFLAFLDRVFNAFGMRDLEFTIGLTLIFPLTYPESNFSVMTGAMALLFATLCLYFAGGSWLLSRFEKTNSPRAND
jgi:hypothetical protein